MWTQLLLVTIICIVHRYEMLATYQALRSMPHLISSPLGPVTQELLLVLNLPTSKEKVRNPPESHRKAVMKLEMKHVSAEPALKLRPNSQHGTCPPRGLANPTVKGCAFSLSPNQPAPSALCQDGGDYPCAEVDGDSSQRCALGNEPSLRKKKKKGYFLDFGA